MLLTFQYALIIDLLNSIDWNKLIFDDTAHVGWPYWVESLLLCSMGTKIVIEKRKKKKAVKRVSILWRQMADARWKGFFCCFQFLVF